MLTNATQPTRGSGQPDGDQSDAGRTYQLIDATGTPVSSAIPGTVGGYKPKRIYGRLDCPGALRHLAAGHYAKHRVFFLDEETAVLAGYRPCARCLPEAYQAWKQTASTPGS